MRGDLVDRIQAEQKAARVGRKANRKAAESWWRLEEAIEKATDAWHYREGYVGSRKGLQVLLMAPDSAATSVMHLPV